jgi:hypothetical protein
MKKVPLIITAIPPILFVLMFVVNSFVYVPGFNAGQICSENFGCVLLGAFLLLLSIPFPIVLLAQFYESRKGKIPHSGFWTLMLGLVMIVLVWAFIYTTFWL